MQMQLSATTLGGMQCEDETDVMGLLYYTGLNGGLSRYKKTEGGAGLGDADGSCFD
jgi:hypothetical protein